MESYYLSMNFYSSLQVGEWRGRHYLLYANLIRKFANNINTHFTVEDVQLAN